MFQGSLSTFVRATHPAHPPRLVAPTALAGGASSSSRPPLDVIELSDSEDELQASTALRSERERDVCTTLRGVEVPPGWSVIGGSLLVWSHLSPAPSAQIAAFDFDDTLAKTALGGFDPNAWTNLFPHVPAVLRRLHADGRKIVVITNESTDRFKKSEAIEKAILKKTGRLMGFAKAAGVPMLVLCATAKDSFRKPATGAWDYLVAEANGGVRPQLSESFYVGDAAGRPRDHSDSDRAFSQAVGLGFHTETEFFKELHSAGGC